MGRSQLGTDDESGYTANEKHIGFVSKPNRLGKKHISSSEPGEKLNQFSQLNLKLKWFRNL